MLPEESSQESSRSAFLLLLSWVRHGATGSGLKTMVLEAEFTAFRGEGKILKQLRCRRSTEWGANP